MHAASPVVTRAEHDAASCNLSRGPNDPDLLAFLPYSAPSSVLSQMQGENKTSLAAGVKPLAGGGGIFKSAAVEVLRRERRLMTTGEITK